MLHDSKTPGSLPTGIFFRSLPTDLQEPDEPRGSRPVLREPGGAIPPGYSTASSANRVVANVACARHLGVRGRRHSLLNPRPSCRCASLSHCRCAAPSNSPCRHTNRVKKWWKQRPESQCPSIDGRQNPSSWHFPTSSDRSYVRFGVPGPSNRPSWNMLHWPSLYPGWWQSSPTTPCRLAALTPIVVDRSRPNCRLSQQSHRD